jgi:hypothetical protein
LLSLGLSKLALPSGMKGRLRSIREAARKPEPRRLKGNVAKQGLAPSPGLVRQRPTNMAG